MDNLKALFLEFHYLSSHPFRMALRFSQSGKHHNIHLIKQYVAPAEKQIET